MKTYGEWSYSSTSLDLGTRWRWVVSFTLLPLYPRGKSARHPYYTKLGGPQNRSRNCGEEKNLALPGIEPGSSSCSQSLYPLSYADSPRKPCHAFLRWHSSRNKNISFEIWFLSVNIGVTSGCIYLQKFCTNWLTMSRPLRLWRF
jgi:hypothetical protein